MWTDPKVQADPDLPRPMRPTRRAFLARAGGAAAGLLAALSGGCAAGRQGLRYAGLRSDAYLGAVRVETRVPGAEVFTEGPAVARDGTVFFSNIPASQILTWHPASRELAVFRAASNGANGLLFDPQGRLLACEADRITRTDLATGRVEVLADRYAGRPFARPNDLTLDARGRLYFTSRGGGPDAAQDAHGPAVYRVDVDGAVHQVLREPAVQMPNGIVVAPGGGALYLVEAHGGAGRNRHLRRYRLHADGRLSDPRRIVEFYPGRSGDGLCVDAEGNVYVAAGLHRMRGTSETLDTRPGIHVFSPEGRLLAFAETPEDTVTNCTFGGADLRTLYVTCGALLLSIPTPHPGNPTYRPAG